jgi:hypothetical protein
MDVVLVRWPAEEPRRAELQEHGVPRLLLVENGAAPPRTADELEDWVRVPADEVDLHARVDNLNRRALSRNQLVPALDDDGVLRAGDGWVPLPPVEARLTTALIDRYRYVVSRDSLAKAG